MSARVGAAPRSTRADLTRGGASFVPEVVADPGFVAAGVAHGNDGDCWWAVVDPRAHPLRVWKKRIGGLAGYADSGRALEAAVFTNGPMMGKRLGSKAKITRGSAARGFAGWASAGLVGGVVAGSGSPYLYGAGGAAVGIAHAWRRTFTNWVPCGAVHGRHAGIDDRRNFDGEGETHAWFGRFADEFSSYRIGRGDLPEGVREGLGGLILLVRDFTPASARIGDAAFDRDFAQLSRKNGVVAWGLVPLDRENDGVIVVIGSHVLDCEDVAARLCAIGTRDAVAMDQSGCIMMGTARHFMIGPPRLHRQAIQLYGLYCR
jgi:hypothetical protein